MQDLRILGVFSALILLSRFASATSVQTEAVSEFYQDDVFVKLSNGEPDTDGKFQNFAMRFPAGGGAISLGFLSNPVDRGAPGTRYKASANSSLVVSTQVAPSTLLGVPTDKWADSGTSLTGAPSARDHHSSVWTGSKMIVWGGNLGYDYGNFQWTVTNTGGIFDPVSNSWTTMSTSGAPSERQNAAAVWTGSKMVVWGGETLGPLSPPTNTGGQYDPAYDSWSSTTTSGAPPTLSWLASAWTGSKLIVWGGNGDTSTTTGYSNQGGLYDPSMNSWTSMTTSGAPNARIAHVGVWTGSKFIVWGGYDENYSYVNTGGVYDPSTNSWSSTSTSGAHAGLYVGNAVWTGSKMLVWGGSPDGWTNTLNTGALYDPAYDTWSAMTTTNAPGDRFGAVGLWTGSRFVVFGGMSLPYYTYLNTGGQYDATNDIWYPMATEGAPSPRAAQSVVQFGNGQLLFWGGLFYNPGGDPIFTSEGSYYFP